VSTLSPQGRRLLALLYVAAAIILLDQLVDLGGGVWPFHPEMPNWRVGSFGVALSRLEFLALADALAVATALYLDHRRVLVFLAVMHLLVGVVLLAGMALFTLDTLQIRRVIRSDRVRQLDIAALRTLAMAGIASLACFALAITVWKTRQRQAKESKPRDAILVTGSPRGSSQ
jgi:hypothetical protein